MRLDTAGDERIGLQIEGDPGRPAGDEPIGGKQVDQRAQLVQIEPARAQFNIDEPVTRLGKGAQSNGARDRIAADRGDDIIERGHVGGEVEPGFHGEPVETAGHAPAAAEPRGKSRGPLRAQFCGAGKGPLRFERQLAGKIDTRIAGQDRRGDMHLPAPGGR